MPKQSMADLNDVKHLLEHDDPEVRRIGNLYRRLGVRSAGAFDILERIVGIGSFEDVSPDMKDLLGEARYFLRTAKRDLEGR